MPKLNDHLKLEICEMGGYKTLIHNPDSNYNQSWLQLIHNSATHNSQVTGYNDDRQNPLQTSFTFLVEQDRVLQWWQIKIRGVRTS